MQHIEYAQRAALLADMLRGSWAAAADTRYAAALIVTRSALEHHLLDLSAFVHPAQRGYDLLYGSNIPSRMGQRDHYCEELVLLYLIAVAAAELEAFGRMSRRKPAAPLLDWETVEREVAEARLATEYFWFLSGDPHQYDRIEEVHTRVWRRRKWGPPDIDWRALPAERVRYYPNPMERLVRMHHTTGEMSTGLVFQSPFDRSDEASRW